MVAATLLVIGLGQRSEAQAVLDRMEAKLSKAKTVAVHTSSSAMGQSHEVDYILMRDSYHWSKDAREETFRSPQVIWRLYSKTKTYRKVLAPDIQFYWPLKGFEGFDRSFKPLKATGHMEPEKRQGRDLLEITVDAETGEALLVDAKTYLPAGFVTPTSQARFVTDYTDIRLNVPAKAADFEWAPKPGWTQAEALSR